MEIASPKNPAPGRRPRQRNASQAEDADHDVSDTKSAAASDSSDQNPYTHFIDLSKSSGLYSQTQPPQVHNYAPPIVPTAPYYTSRRAPHVESPVDAERRGKEASLHDYFLPSYGISSAVIQEEVRYFCGPDAIVRSFAHQVRAGGD